MTAPKIIILAGPNGAGKTTFAREFLPQEASCPVFVNADLIAAGLSPFAPERAAMQAGRLMLDAIGQHVARLESFAFDRKNLNLHLFLINDFLLYSILFLV